MDTPFSFDRAAEYYDETRAFPPAVAGPVIASLARALDPGSHILEIGIGTGRISIPLFERGFNITGLDLSRKMMGQLQEKLPPPHPRPTLVLGNAIDLPFRSGIFNTILAVHILHLIPAWQEAVKEVLRVLARGGGFIVGFERHSPGAINARIREQWDVISRAHGYSRSQLVKFEPELMQDFLHELGASREEWIACEWSRTDTPKQVIDRINSRKWSSTWLVPEDIFPTTIAELRLWAMQEIGDLDQSYSQTTQYIWERYWWNI